MAEPQAYSIAELTRCKLLYEASVKDRDLRRIVGHVNMYDKLIDLMSAEEMREREQSPPKSIYIESNNRRVKFSGCPSQGRFNQQISEQLGDVVHSEKKTDAFAFGSHCERVSFGCQDGYAVVEVAEVEIVDDGD
ncbi:hypothetical protein NA56DRAFT_645835 [Hyaloscypha hepaticicola]|uniref:Uncharacterized protein n=1 Tax=Hyaloscypha hepaticicola TaxID=2082293 RepID=A0A2J6Q498_9HELO|nr:hypothetical protein NA56DRAFT_645835 [Hyaloscypha hepaticicola]